MFGVVPLICAKKSFINQADAKGEWGGGGGGRRTGLRKVKAQITIVRGSNINEIQRFAKIPETARD